MTHPTRSEYRCDAACAATDATAALFVLDVLGSLASEGVRRDGALLIFPTVKLSAIKLWMHTFDGQSPFRGDG